MTYGKTTTFTAPTFLSEGDYLAEAATCQRRGFPQLAAFWRRRAQQAQESATARAIIAEARLRSELEAAAMDAMEAE
jgi:ferritin